MRDRGGNAPTRRPLLTIQAKLVVGASNDAAEREADAVADRVMASIGRSHFEPDDPASASSLLDSSLLDGAVRTPAITRISRMASPQDATIGADGGAIDPDTERSIASARSGGTALPARIRRSMEGAMGADFSGVRLHVGAQADALNERIQARAFTTGSDIFVRRQDHAPDTERGQRLLAHELAHTVQQGASPTRVSRSLAPGIIQRDDKADAEALEASDRLESPHYGHALGRHGPDVSDAALKTRLQTGLAPDGEYVPVAGDDADSGISSKFADHKTYLETRAAAWAKAKSILDATADHLKQLAQEAKVAIEAFAAASPTEKKDKVGAKTTAMKLLNETTDKTRVPSNGEKWAPIELAVAKKDVEGIVKDGGVKLDGLFTLRPEYEMVVDHGKPIGYGFKGEQGKNVPKPTAPGKNMRVFDDPAPTKLDMPKTRTTFKVKGPMLLIAKTYTPSAWAVIQHFPADDGVGMRIKGATEPKKKP